MSGTSIDLTLDEKICDAITKGGTITIVAPIKLKLLKTNGDNATNGTEITPGGSYAAGGFAVDGNMGAATAVSGRAQVENSSVISQTNMPACTVTGGELWDSSATPQRVAQGPLTASKTLAAGDTFSVAAGSFVFSLA